MPFGKARESTSSSARSGPASGNSRVPWPTTTGQVSREISWTHVMASLSNSGLAQPPRSIPGSRFSSRPPFACITPSTETWVVVVSFMVTAPFSCRARLRTWVSFPDPRVTYNYMVVDEVPTEVVDEVFRALADSPRRDILRRCAADEPSVSRLAQAYPMSFAAVQKHVAVLERAGLVVKVRRGREQLVHTDAAAVERARQALDELVATWRGRVERMSNVLATGGTN